MKSILVNEEINRRNLEDLVSIRQSTFISQIATATVVALLRVVIFDFTALCRINKFSGMTGMTIKLRPGKPGLPAPSCRGCRLRRNLSTQAEELLFVSVDHERSETHEPHKVQTAKLSSDPGNFYLEGEGAVLRVTDG